LGREDGRCDGTGKPDGVFNGGCEAMGVGAFDGVYDAAIVEDEEGWHRPHSILLGDFLLVVDVYFGEGDPVWLGVFRGE